jgi:hypothetical protein
MKYTIVSEYRALVSEQYTSALSQQLHAVDASDFRSAFGAAACAAGFVAGFFVIFTATHLFFDARMFNKLAKPFDGIVDRLIFPQPQSNHENILDSCQKKQCLPLFVISRVQSIAEKKQEANQRCAWTSKS